MDNATAARVNALMEQVRKDITDMEQCSTAMQTMMTTQASQLTKLKNGLSTIEQKHATMYHMQLQKLKDASNIQLQRERHALAHCKLKRQDEGRLQNDYTAAKDEVEAMIQDVKQSKSDQEKMEKDITDNHERVALRKASLVQLEERMRKSQNAEEEIQYKFQTVLGLKVKAVDDHALELTFTHIDPANAEAQFQVTVMTKNNNYRAVNCSPRIAVIDQLDEALSSRKIGLPAFVREVRTAFVRYVTVDE